LTYESDEEGYYQYRERRGKWLGYAAVFGLGVVVGALLFSRGCLCAPEEEEPEETAATAETAAAEVPEEVPAAPETAATAEDVIVFEEPAPAPATPPQPAPPPARPPEPVTPRTPARGLTADQINQTITKRRAGIQSEYNSLLKNNPTLGGGKVTVRFTISSRGDVTSAEIVEDTLGSAGLRAGILRRVRSWKFPRAQGEATVVYPFVFVAGGS
jgi:TonB family protein